MEKPREYQVTDLFYTQWSDLSAGQRVKIHELNVARNEQPLEQQGTYIILIMRELRKRPLLVDRLNEAQVVDIFNSLTFLAKPWLFFAAPPTRLALRGYAAPDAKMGNLTFDHFIYADSEFTQCGGDEKAALQHMETLAAILYSPGKLVTNKSYKLPAANALFVKQAFYTFGNVRDYIVSACTHLFPAPAEDAKPMPRNTSALQLWTDMKYALAEQGVFGTYKEVGEQPLYEVITYLEKRAKDPKPTPHAHGS
jgi:hypothetical protein